MTTLPSAIRFRPLASGPETLTLTPGEDGFAALVPLTEPLSAGAPPVNPTLVRRAESPYRVRWVEAGSGQSVTCSLATAGSARAVYAVRWTKLTKAQRDALWAFLVTDPAGVQAGGEGGGVLGFELEPDGAGSGEDPILVRPVGPVREEHLCRRAGGGAGGVYELGEILCEELF